MELLASDRAVGILAAIPLLLWLTPSPASAQCDWRPPHPSPVTENIVIFPDSSIDGTLAPILQQAVSAIATELTNTSSHVHMSYVSGTGRSILVKLDTTLGQGSEWGYYDNVSDVIGINPYATNFGDTFLRFLFTHEVMHTLGYSNVDCAQGASIEVEGGPGDPNATSLTSNDDCAIGADFGGGGDGGGGGDPGCRSDPCSPILISFDQHEIRLTAPDVLFDLAADGQPNTSSWTDPTANVGFLAIDLNANGLIDTGRELFGNAMLIGGRRAANGFQALAWYDETSHGGDGDGVISPNDQIFSALLVWFDRNHNGRTDGGELVPAASTGLVEISVAAQWSGKRDEYGNRFAYRSPVSIDAPGPSKRFAYDVYLASR